MRAITIRQPYADAIVQPSAIPKRTENRTWRPPAELLGVRFLVHAGLLGDRAAVLAGVRPGPDVRGAILGAATVTGYHQDDGQCCPEWGMRSGIKPLFHWDLADVISLDRPVPAKGALQFWTPAPDVLAAVQRQIEAVAR